MAELEREQARRVTVSLLPVAEVARAREEQPVGAAIEGQHC
jgi:hypothetical protein